MEYQYHAPRFRLLPDGRQVGTITVGTILYIQDGVSPFRFPDRVIRREPWRVEAWIPRQYTVRDPRTGLHRSVPCAGGHLALVRSLRDSRRTTHVADWLLLRCTDAGLDWWFTPKNRRTQGTPQDNSPGRIKPASSPASSPVSLASSSRVADGAASQPHRRPGATTIP